MRILHAGRAYRDYLDMCLFYAVNTILGRTKEVLDSEAVDRLLELVHAAGADEFR